MNCSYCTVTEFSIAYHLSILTERVCVNVKWLANEGIASLKGKDFPLIKVCLEKVGVFWASSDVVCGCSAAGAELLAGPVGLEEDEKVFFTVQKGMRVSLFSRSKTRREGN